MNTPVVTVSGQIGRIFEGEVPETLCFVPADCIIDEGDDLRIAEISYVRGGWDVRNMRFNHAADGEHLFPDSQRPVADLSLEPVRIFLGRLEILRCA